MPRNYYSGHPFAEAHEGYFVVQADGEVDECKDAPVHVAIVVDVGGYGPHAGSLYVDQENRYHSASAAKDTALQEAYEAHEHWMEEHYGDHLKELEAERLKEHVDEYLDTHRGATRDEAIEAVQEDAYIEAGEWFRENMDVVMWKLTPSEFIEALKSWPEKYRKVVEDGVSITTREECD